MERFEELGIISRYIKDENFDESVFTLVNEINTDRHTVYSFENIGNRYIVKLFNREESFKNEIQGYEFAVKKNVKTYRMIEHASTNTGKKYIVTSVIPGESGENMINTSNLNHLLYQMGENIGLLHTNSIEGTPGHGERLAKKTTFLKDIIREDGVGCNIGSGTSSDIGSDISSDVSNNLGNDEEQQFLLATCDKCGELIRSMSFDDVRFGYGHGDFGLQNVKAQDGTLTGIFDFEMSGYTNTELDLIQVYRKHLFNNPEAEKAFFDGYCKHMKLSEGFEKRKYVYMLLESIINCSWSFNKKHEYYVENINFIREILSLKRLCYCMSR